MDPRRSAGEWVAAPSGPNWSPADIVARIPALIAPLLIIAGTASALQVPVNPYDGGLTLTLSRFTSLSTLPYRDLWTLYGPGPPVYGSVIMQIFGRGTLPIRLGFVALQAALALAVYLLSRRYVGRWASAALAIPIASITWSQFQFHFTSSVVFILWGAWFLLRAQDNPIRTVRRTLIGVLLIGTSFWGRYEFAPFAVMLVILSWWWLRPSLGRSARWVLVAGLLPSVLFALYLLGIVGFDRVWLDLVEYPAGYYSRPYCRGLPPVWGSAWDAVIAPFRGRFWTSHDIVLALGTFAPPVVGGGAVALGLSRWRRRDAADLVSGLAGLTAIFVWLELRTRAGAEPDPVWAPLMVSAAPLIAGISRLWLRRLAVAVPALLIVILVLTSWLPANLPAWKSWPPYDPLYGFARLDETFLFHRQKWERLTDVVHRFAEPDDPVFVALKENTGHFANMAVFYWVVDRAPGSRYIGFAPCLTDTAPVQREIVSELADTNVVIQAAYFAKSPPPFAPPSTVLDGYLRDEFDVAYRDSVMSEDDVVVLVRRARRK